MDAVSIISSVSKIAILAFAVTLGVVAYEVFVLVKKHQAEQRPDDHVDLPDFDSAAPIDKHFTEISVTPGQAPVAAATTAPVSSKLPVALVGIVCLVLIAGAGYFFYSRSRASTSEQKVKSPIADSQRTPTQKPTAVPTRTPSPTATPTVLPTATPTLKLTPTILLTASPVPTGALSPTAGASTTPLTVTATPQPTSVNLPTAGNFQTPLLISVVSVAVIYLALIL